MVDFKIEVLFRFKSVVVIGVFGKFGKIGYVIMKNFVDYGYEGKIYVVNVKGGEIEISGRKFLVYKSIFDVFDEVDMVVIVVFVKFVL